MFAALVAAALVAPADTPKEKEKELPEAAKKELKALEGKWKVVKVVVAKDGEVELKATDPDRLFVFKGTELTMQYGDKKEVVRIETIDASTDPKCLDLIETRRDNTERTVEGVYKIDKDTLKFAFCVPKEGKQRPTGFDTPADNRTLVWILKRVKE